MVDGGAKCGPYELFGKKEGEPFDSSEGALVLWAEEPYLVRLAEGAPRNVLKGALKIHPHAGEGTLRFGNFIGRAVLGGRALDVRSRRLEPDAASKMLDEVSAWLGSLPFGWDGPTSAAYSTRREATPEILYHAFALIRDAYRRLGPHDLSGALERILSQPHESLEHGEPRLIALGAATHIDADTLVAVPQLAEHLQPVPAGSPQAALPAARALDGMLPESLRVRPFTESTDNAENRYVLHLLDDLIDLLRRFARMVRAAEQPAATVNLREADEIADFLDRCRRHRVLADVPADPRLPAHSTVLRRRPGYRELMALHAALDERLRTAEVHPMARLLESRDAADIYEYWCFIQVVRTLEEDLGPPLSAHPFKVSDTGSRLPWRYRVTWAELTATYNDTFPRADPADWKHAKNSYSLRLRPDIVLRWTEDDRLDLFDAKLKVEFDDVIQDDEDEDEGANEEELAVSDKFKPADLHKMHAYRDALQAASVWVLYPGSDKKPFEYAAPGAAADPGAPAGVGAIALTPGEGDDGGLGAVLKAIRERRRSANGG